MQKHLLLLLVVLQQLSIVNRASAQQGGIGGDMWTDRMNREALFTPHVNWCNSSTEVFVAVDSAGKGFCIEKDERTAAAWTAARNACLADEKRLPEPGEFRYACDTATGLNNMTDDWEWASNYAGQMVRGNYNEGLAVAVLGSGSCSATSWAWMGTTAGNTDSLVYRCVR